MVAFKLSGFIAQFRIVFSATAHKKKTERLLKHCTVLYTFIFLKTQTNPTLSQLILCFSSDATGALQEKFKSGQEVASEGGSGRKLESDAQPSFLFSELVNFKLVQELCVARVVG